MSLATKFLPSVFGLNESYDAEFWDCTEVSSEMVTAASVRNALTP